MKAQFLLVVISFVLVLTHRSNAQVESPDSTAITSKPMSDTPGFGITVGSGISTSGTSIHAKLTGRTSSMTFGIRTMHTQNAERVSLYENSILYGVSTRISSEVRLTTMFGLGVIRGDGIDKSVSIPFELEWTVIPVSFLGFSLASFGSFNLEEAFFGAGFALHLGALR